MLFIGKEATLEAAEAAGDQCGLLFAYPSDDDCLWLGWDEDEYRDLEDSFVRFALFMTLCKELNIEQTPNGTRYEVADSVIRPVLNSITGKGPMWWESLGHKFIRQKTTRPKGFA